jgi:ketosteroid isomerase-like protein
VAQANLDVVRSIYAAWQRGDFSSVHWAHPDIEYVLVGGPNPGSWTGLAGMAEGSRGFLDAWDEFRTTPEAYRELDDERVLVLVDWTARGKTSGLDIGRTGALLGQGAKGANLFHVREGKVTRFVVYWDRRRAFADVGLPSELDS